MHSWQAGDIEANGIKLHYTRTGGNKPPVVLAHGFSDDGLCWTPVAEVLAPEYDVIMVDARGHGGSAAPEQGYGPAAQADDLAGVITGLGLRCPALLGHSMGAATTLALAGMYPELPGAILLEDPPAWWVTQPEQSPQDEDLQVRRRLSLMALQQKTREQLIADQHAQTPSWSDAELGPWADSKLRLSLTIVNRSGSAVVDWAAILPRIRCPALLITADPEQGAIVTSESAAALQALVPQLRIAHISGAGHSIRREQFGRYMEDVQAFLAGWQPQQ
ncbi:MAG: alpha/beta hydrolase [Herpetosiphonaceae bacterium]|nr:alpha/beta hydrolase [Herpetosiphonaceae bacterium]